jgi:hypothetical protein
MSRICPLEKECKEAVDRYCAHGTCGVSDCPSDERIAAVLDEHHEEIKAAAKLLAERSRCECDGYVIVGFPCATCAGSGWVYR